MDGLRYWPLSDREGRIVELMMSGDDNTVIAEKLGVQSGTVWTHQSRIRRKLKGVAIPVWYETRKGNL